MSHRIIDWDPEDVVAWAAGNKNIARRNLIWSVAAEHIGFSAGDKFLLGATATLVGACLRIPCTLATATSAAAIGPSSRRSCC
jgi:MFS transporter, NNP family, nitrate/nitrite transporter